MNLPGFFEGLGECRRTSPNTYVTLRAFTEEQDAEFSKTLKTHDAEFAKAREEWDKRREDELRAAEVHLENIRESLKTCRDSSADHWKAELAKQEEKIEKISQAGRDFEFVEFWSSKHPEPELKPFKVLKGMWPLTASDEFCGEWQQR